MLNLKTLTVCAALSACFLAAGPGCADKKTADDSSMMNMSGMSKDDLMQKGEQMVSQGQTMQSNADSMPDGSTASNGMSKSDMLDKAKTLIQKGQQMIEKAKGM